MSNPANTTPQASAGGKKEQMRQMFNRIAPSYDKLNHILTLNIDRGWRKRGVKLVQEGDPKRILDLATGTADLAIYMAQRMVESSVVGVDLSSEMLEVGRQKVTTARLSERICLVEGDAEALAFDDGSFDAVTVAFGIRNFARLALCFKEMYRVLGEGGRVMILELSTPQHRLVRWCYELYAFRFIPFLGGLIARDRAAYRYLPNSIRAFHAPQRVVEMMQEAGFTQVKKERKCFGIAHIYTAQK
ncbi:MAG: bifunctional demethylmenaquinone methyltransferase/2-methoxy-6-polyprenyl-1,4-benzoquinol methylase UbiE [Alistipes sp.]|nr:bifunctional demethylmenaquinone methyltransferase/2-methoxy-6-polyprenyl-1,4-benzoquinol methylase UbiE [Alistipes sp.]